MERRTHGTGLRSGFRTHLGAMGTRTRLPVEHGKGLGKHGQAGTLAHGTPSASLGKLPVLQALFSALLLLLLVSGCAQPIIPAPPGADEPGNPGAAETPLPPRSHALDLNDMPVDAGNSVHVHQHGGAVQ
jgi:hypothetical protein